MVSLRSLLCSIVVSVCLLPTMTNAQAPSGYYNTATGTGYALKTQLHNIINDHTVRSYSSLWTYYGDTDIDPDDGFIWDMYSEVPNTSGGATDGNDPYNYTLGTNQCGNFSGENSCYNREHSFPKSWFSDASPMTTDIHHVVPTDGYVNGQRSNLVYGEVSSASFTSQNGSKKGSSAISGYTGTVFEPIDEYKGDFARIYFYMATRYEDVVTGWSSDMLNGSTDQVYEDWALDMLIDWHNNDPVSQKEIDRNNEIYTSVQLNRNPFIDNPDYVAQVWGGASSCSSEPTLAASGINVTSVSDSEATVSWTNGDGTNRLVVVSVSGITFSPADNTDYSGGASSDFSSATDLGSGDKAVYGSVGNSVSISGLTQNTTYNVEVFEYCSTGPDYLTSGAIPASSFTTTTTPTTILSEGFSDCNSVSWSSEDISGTGTWACSGGATEMDGYQNGTSADWLISAAINFNNFTNETFSFMSRARYSGGDDIEVHYSTTYSGTGDPTSFFTQISQSQFSLPSPGSGNTFSDWLSSGNIDISFIDGSAVYLAIKYTADGTSGGSETWQVDDLLIQGIAAGSPCVEPVNQPTSLSLLESGESVSGSFTVSVDADQYLVLISQNSSLSENPVDGTSYNSEETLGNATAVSLGSSNTFVEGGLLEGTQYYVYVFGLNSLGCSGGPEYNVTSPLTGNITTTAPPICIEPTQPAESLGLTVASASQIDGSFSFPSSAPDGYLVIRTTNSVYAGSPSDAVAYALNDAIAVDGTVIGLGNQNSFSATTLTAATTYYFHVFAYNDSDCSGGPDYLISSSLTGNATTSPASTGTTVTFDFEGFDGSGFASAPASGQLDADDWKITGLSDGTKEFGVEGTGGDYAKGTQSGGITGGGVYAFSTGSDNETLGVQPTGSDFTPGTFVLRLENTTGGEVTEINVSYDIFYLNDQTRASTFNFAHSSSDGSYTNVGALDFTTPQALDATGWQNVNRTTTLSSISVADGAFYYFQWSSSDAGGTGSRDQFGIDNVSIELVQTTCSPVSTITNFYPIEGPVGSDITLLGTGFNQGTGTTEISIGPESATFSVVSDTEITITVPVNISTNQIGVTTNGCQVNSTQSFTLFANDCVASSIDDLFISEYLEGSGADNKFLEIYNGTGATVDLVGYDLVRYSNGSSTEGTALTFSSGTNISDGDVYVIGRSTALFTPDLVSTADAMSFNGDDALALRKGGVVIDVIGQIGNDPGSQWGSSPNTTADHTLVRKSSISSGDADGSDAFDPATEWDASAQNTATNLGAHTVSLSSAPTISVQPSDQNECSTAAFTVSASGTIDSYQWRVFDGSSWYDLTDNNVYSGTTTATLSIDDVSGDLEGYQFYCQVVQTGVCTNITNTAMLSVVGVSGTSGSWTGSSSQDWSNCKNWSDGNVPSEATDVIVATGTNPQVSSNITLNNLELSGGSSLEIVGAVTVEVLGNLTVASGASLDGTSGSSLLQMTGVRKELNIQGTLEPNTDLEIAGSAEISLTNNLVLDNESNDLTIAAGGTFDFNGFTVSGSSGDFFLSAGANVKITSDVGISAMGTASGNVQTDDRSFDAGANYIYSRSSSQNTGSGLPGTIAGLTVAKTSGDLTLSSPLSLTGDLTFDGSGNLLTGGNKITLSSASSIVGEGVDGRVIGEVEMAEAVNNNTVNFGNLGVSLTTTENLGNTTVSRVTGSAGISTNLGTSNAGIAATWAINPATQPTGTVSGTLTWLSAYDNAKDVDDLYVWKNSGSGWELLQAAANSGSGDVRIVSFTTDAFSDFTVSDGSSPLPVELVSFKGKVSNGAVELSWMTATEVNNKGFWIEKSADALTFDSLGFVKGNGNSNSINQYSYLDKNVSSSRFYRLRQVDFDGQVEFSKVILVETSLDENISLSPNPVSSNQRWQLLYSSELENEVARLVLRSIGGEVIASFSGSLRDVREDIEQAHVLLEPGIYLLSLRVGESSTSIKVLKE